MIDIQIKTEIHGDLIVQEVTDLSMRNLGDDRRRVIATEVMNTKDSQIREALIRMGWIPPRVGPEIKPVSMCIVEETEHAHTTTCYPSIQEFRKAKDAARPAVKRARAGLELARKAAGV
jgi:hypothetical protein